MKDFEFDGPTRYVANAKERFRQYKEGADNYTRTLTDEQKLGFSQKPFDWGQDHPHFFSAMFQILNGLSTLRLSPGSTIIEVGSGAGWVTEILLALNYRVICIEPAEQMIEAAKSRVRQFLDLRQMSGFFDHASFIHDTFEEADISGGQADAILFFESFHHLIDEHASVEKCNRLLKDNGAICILGDSNWVPGQRESEKFWDAEMKMFGTLESPFTERYIVSLLRHYGFGDAQRYHGVNAMVPVNRGGEPVVNFAGHLNARYVNLVIARKNTPVPNGLAGIVETKPTDRPPQAAGGVFAQAKQYLKRLIPSSRGR